MIQKMLCALALLTLGVSNPSLICDVKNTLGEGCLWLEHDQSLIWTDIEGKALYQAREKDGVWTPEKHPVGMRVGGMSIQKDGRILLFGDNGRVDEADISHPTWTYKTLIDHLPGEEGLRFNDGSADPRGRIFFGTYGDRPGRLYRFDPDGSYRVVADGIGCSNGIDWTPDEKFMYHTDSGEKTIYKYSYDIKTGEISNRTVWLKWNGPGVPDGMTVDQAGNVWTAIWGEGLVVKLSPRGQELARYRTGVPHTTCLTFGGVKASDLYITSAQGGDGASAEAGGVFILPGVGPGRTERRSDYPSKVK